MDYRIDPLKFLPEFLKESDLMLSIMDCLKALISKEQPVFEEVDNAYDDMLFKTRDYAKLSSAAKIEVVKELGFGYLLDVFPLTDEQLTRLLIFFNLIYFLKGKAEGLDICLRTLGITEFTYTEWDKQVPKGIPFTALLSIVGDTFSDVQILRKIKDFVRAYMLPWIDVLVEITVPAGNLYIYPWKGRLTKIKNDTPNVAERDFSIKPATETVIPETFLNRNISLKKYTLTIEGPEGSTVTINDKKVSTGSYEMGSYVTYKVSKPGYYDYINHIDLVCNITKIIELVKQK